MRYIAVTMIILLRLGITAFVQKYISSADAHKHIGETFWISGHLCDGKIERSLLMPNSLDEILYIGKTPPTANFIIIMRMSNFKGNLLTVFRKKIDFKKESSTYPELLVKGTIFLYKGMPAVRIHPNELRAWEQLDNAH